MRELFNQLDSRLRGNDGDNGLSGIISQYIVSGMADVRVWTELEWNAGANLHLRYALCNSISMSKVKLNTLLCIPCTNFICASRIGRVHFVHHGAWNAPYIMIAVLK